MKSRRRRKWDRDYAVGRARRLLLRKGRPRLQVAFLLLLTGCAGFLLSFALLHAGLTAMWLRYPLVILLSYGVLLLLLWAWLGVQRRRRRGTSFDLNLDLDLVPDVHLRGGGGGGSSSFGGFGGGQDFGGGGAGGNWIEAGAAQTPSGGGGGGGLGILDSLDVDLPVDGDEGCLVVLAVVALAAAVVAGLLAAFYVVYVAPVLLAEILVDGLLVTGLYRKMKYVEEQHWLESVVRRTLALVAVTLLFFTLAGYLMQRAAPEAHSIGGFWERVSAPRQKRPGGR